MPEIVDEVFRRRVANIINALSIIAIGGYERIHLPVEKEDELGLVEEMLGLFAQEHADTTRRYAEYLKAMEQLLGIVGHDLRSPVAALLVTVEGMARQPDLPESLRPALGRLVRASTRIQDVTAVLLDYAQARLGGTLTLARREVNLGQLCVRAIERLKADYPERQVLLTTEGDLNGTFDPDRLLHALMHLVDNALRYGDASQPVRVRAEGRQTEVVLEVHNQGAPIAPELRPLLFQPFQHGAREESMVRVSLGLGLYLVRQISLAHGGVVEMESTAEGGTRFAIRLPRQFLPEQFVESYMESVPSL